MLSLYGKDSNQRFCKRYGRGVMSKMAKKNVGRASVTQEESRRSEIQ